MRCRDGTRDRSWGADACEDCSCSSRIRHTRGSSSLPAPYPHGSDKSVLAKYYSANIGWLYSHYIVSLHGIDLAFREEPKPRRFTDGNGPDANTLLLMNTFEWAEHGRLGAIAYQQQRLLVAIYDFWEPDLRAKLEVGREKNSVQSVFFGALRNIRIACTHHFGIVHADDVTKTRKHLEALKASYRDQALLFDLALSKIDAGKSILFPETVITLFIKLAVEEVKDVVRRLREESFLPTNADAKKEQPTQRSKMRGRSNNLNNNNNK